MSATAENVTWAELAPGPADPVAPAAAGLDPELGTDLLVHLEAQLQSVRRMHQVVLTQAAAIRRRDVRQVVASTGELQVEMHRRELLERQRAELMLRAARELSTRPEDIGFTSVQQLMDPDTAEVAAALTAELTRLLREVDREHRLNRRLMAQELAFLNHLLGLAEGTGGYAARPRAASPQILRNVNATRRRVFDLEA